MIWLLDTNVVSESVRPAPDPNVGRWLAEVEPARVFLSVVSFAEIRRGVSRLPPGQRRRGLETWLARELLPRFEGRLLAIDGAVAEEWGRVMARAERAGRVPSPLDGFLAATALYHDMTLVTRNVADFAATGARCLDPSRPAAH